MSTNSYLDLQRKFIEVDISGTSEIDDFAYGFNGKDVGWSTVLTRRTSVIQAPANFGKTTESEQAAARLRKDGQRAVFVALRKVRSRGDFETALGGDDFDSYSLWKRNTSATLTVFIDSLDEASPNDLGDLSMSLSLVTRTLNWPTADIRWVITTRPALLTNSVINLLRRQFNRGATLTASLEGELGTPKQSLHEAVFSERLANPETLAIFRLAPIERSQAVTYLRDRLHVANASEVLAIATRRGLSSLTSNPGGLSMLADIDLVNSPPDSLTEILERLEQAVWIRISRDQRIKDAGSEAMDCVKQTVRRLAAASQLCHLPNIELPQDDLLSTADALSARLIAGGAISESVLLALLGSHGFIDSDSGHHQVKIFPDELPPYMGALYLSELVKSPEAAHQLLAALSWEASSGERGVAKRLLPLIGWLGTLNAHCRVEILRIDPQALAFFGDLRNSNVSATEAEMTLRRAFENMLERHEYPGRGQFRLTSENYWQAGSQRLEPALRDLFKLCDGNSRAQGVLLDIAAYAGTAVLRVTILAKHSGNLNSMIAEPQDASHIIELGRAEDLDGMVSALLKSSAASESLTTELIEKVGWSRLTPRDVVALLQKTLLQRSGGYQLASCIRHQLVPSATDMQLFEFARRLALKVASTRDKSGRRTFANHQANERFLEIAGEVLAEAIRRTSIRLTNRLALILLVLYRHVRKGLFGTADLHELKSALKDGTEVRRALLRRLVRWSKSEGDDAASYLYGYGAFCSPTRDDVKALGLATLKKAFDEQTAGAAVAKRKTDRAAATGNQLKLSSKSRTELLKEVPGIRNATSLSAITWVVNWLMQTNSNARYGEISFQQFRTRSGKQIADAVQAGFSKLWRERAPTFRQTEPNSTFLITVAGLQGLYMELGKGDALPKLSSAEVRQAIRYAAFEINGYPDWFWPLVNAHIEIAGEELEAIAKSADCGDVSRRHAENLFAGLDTASVEIRERLAPLAWQALQVSRSDDREFVVGRMLRIAGTSGGIASDAEFEKLAWQKISYAYPDRGSKLEYEVDGMSSAHGQSMAWGKHWLKRSPRSFVERMQSWTGEHRVAANTFLYSLASELGSEHGASLRTVGNGAHDGVDSLGALYVLMLSVVDPKEDDEHLEGEGYMVSSRDNAQDFRESIVPAIANVGTERAYLVLEWLKRKLPAEKTTQFKYYQHILRENTLSPSPISQRDFSKFESNIFKRVTDGQSFARSVQSALLAVKYDIEQGEHSLRRFFSQVNFDSIRTDNIALALESDFQQLLASELKHHAKSQFGVHREPETAEHNRRDILCTKESLGLSVSIEIKMSERWTILQYLEALEKQLVEQYMRHRNAKSGFLVIVLQRAREWREPHTRKRVQFSGLITLLQERANFLMGEDSTLFLRIVGIDAVARKNFRTLSSATYRS